MSPAPLPVGVPAARDEGQVWRSVCGTPAHGCWQRYERRNRLTNVDIPALRLFRRSTSCHYSFLKVPAGC